ncbi:MAG: DUF1641 domain-containing protein [Chloroflexota bacterium]
MDKDLDLLHQKVDSIMVYMAEQQQRQQSFEELKNDMIPIANHMIKLTIDELAEIGTEFRSEDLFFLVKRLLRNTNLLIKMTDTLESAMGFTDEASILGKQMLNQAVMQLDAMEQKGYFRFGSEGLKILDSVVTEFGEEGLQDIGENVVPLLQMVRQMTAALTEAPSEGKPPSALGLLREINDPQVRRGMAKMLEVLKSLAPEPAV